jgi:hypothetical protein
MLRWIKYTKRGAKRLIVVSFVRMSHRPRVSEKRIVALGMKVSRDGASRKWPSVRDLDIGADGHIGVEVL